MRSILFATAIRASSAVLVGAQTTESAGGWIQRSDAFAARLIQARALAALNHSHLVTVHEVGEVEGRDVRQQRSTLVHEVLAWYDKYLGRVN